MNCVLVPAYRPAFSDLSRLLRQSRSLSTDHVQMFVILSSGMEKNDFLQNNPEDARGVHLITLDSLLSRWTYPGVTLDTLMKSTNTQCWEPRRTVSGIKKMVGLAHIHRKHNCTYGWVLDSESVPLRRFSFRDVFRSYIEQPRVVVTNMTHPLILPSRRNDQLNRCAARGLGLRNVPDVSYRTLDYWIYHISDLQHMMMHVQKVHGMPFLHAYVKYPASDPIYYGMYQMQRGMQFVSVPELFVQTTSLTTRARLHNELSRFIWTCDSSNTWTLSQRQRILNERLDFVRGWRFDHLPAEGCRDVWTLFADSPRVVWATSNFKHQLPLPSR